MAVRAWLAACDPELEIDAQLVKSELVTNAVKYGRAPILLVADVAEQDLRLGVCDGGTHLPRQRRSGPAGGGWGLPIVQRLAERWGTALNPMRVWCELRHDRPDEGGTDEGKVAATAGLGAH